GAVDPDLEMQVWPGGVAVGADGGDLLARVHALTRMHRVLPHVAVHRDRAVVVPDPNPEAEAAGRTGLDDGAVGDRPDRRSGRIGDVDAAVHGAPPRAEAGGQRAMGGQNESRSTRLAHLRRGATANGRRAI